MLFPDPLVPAVIIRRYKRFLADVRLGDGSALTVHCPNPGAMIGCAEPGWPALISRSPNPGRKLSHTLELVHNGRCWIGVNTGIANAVVGRALEAGRVSALAGYETIRREVAYGTGSRVDFLLSGPGGHCYLEVKSVTMVVDGLYAFPDAVTARGLKHLKELDGMVRAGHRAVLLFLIQRSDGGHGFRVAGEIDPDYARALDMAVLNGVEVLACLTAIGPDGIRLEGLVPFHPWDGHGTGRTWKPRPSATSDQLQPPSGI